MIYEITIYEILWNSIPRISFNPFCTSEKKETLIARNLLVSEI